MVRCNVRAVRALIVAAAVVEVEDLAEAMTIRDAVLRHQQEQMEVALQEAGATADELSAIMQYVEPMVSILDA